mgnify:CR=1 FL=1
MLDLAALSVDLELESGMNAVLLARVEGQHVLPCTSMTSPATFGKQVDEADRPEP